MTLCRLVKRASGNPPTEVDFLLASGISRALTVSLTNPVPQRGANSVYLIVYISDKRPGIQKSENKVKMFSVNY